MFFRKIIEFLVYSNLWISTGAFLFGLLFYILAEIQIDYHTLGFLFSATILTYTFQRYMKIHYSELLVGPRMKWMLDNLIFVKVLLFLSSLSTVFFSVYLSLPSLITLFILGAISFFYAFKFKLTSKRTNLRDIPGIKIFLIGLVWALSCAIIPAVEAEMLNFKTWTISASFFLFIVGITIPFDIRDIDFDEVNKMTIPQVIGEMRSKILASLIICISFWLMDTSFQFIIASISGAFLSVTLVLLSKKNRDELFFSFVLDGLLIAVPLVFYLLSRPDFITN